MTTGSGYRAAPASLPGAWAGGGSAWAGKAALGSVYVLQKWTSVHYYS